METILGDIPTWITAAVAVVAAVVGLGQYRDQVAVSKENAERERRAQASQLVAWLVVEEQSGLNDPAASPPAPRWGLLLRNSSELTFSNVRVETNFGEHKAIAKVVTLPPGDIFLPRGRKTDRYDFGFPEFVANVADDFKPVNSAKYMVNGLTFRDNQGQHWAISAEGLLADSVSAV